MSHGLTIRADGTVEMAYARNGGTPWHRLGVSIPTAMTPIEAFSVASMDWDVGLQAVYIKLPDGTYREIDEHAAIVRQDNKYVTGMATWKYEPVQLRELVGIADTLCGESGARIDTIGSLHGGKTVFFSALLPGEIDIKGTGDKIQRYLLVWAGHTGKDGINGLDTPVRVVCANTLQMALGNSNRKFAFRHTRNVHDSIRDTQNLLLKSTEFYKQQAYFWDLLAGKQVLEEEATNFFKRVLPDADPENPATRTVNARERMLDLFHNGQGQRDWESISNSAWSALQAVTEYADHELPSRGKSDAERADNRASSILWGTGASLKQKAYEEALQLVGVSSIDDLDVSFS